MTNRTLRRTCISLTAVAALTGVAACGGSSDDGGSSAKGGDKSSSKDGGKKEGGSFSPLAALRTVASTTDKAESSKIEGTTVMGSQMSMKMNGAMSWDDGVVGDMKVTFTGGQMAQQMEQLGGSSIDYRYLPDAYYANMGDKFAQQAGGKHWIKYDYATLAEMAGASGEYLKDQMENTTPNQSVKMLLASGDVKKVGDEKVRGVNATHYSGTVDVADLAGKSSDLDEKQLSALKKQLDQAGIKTEKVDIWVNDEDLLVKKVEKGEMKEGTFSSTVFYSDYGTEVKTTEPPAGDTMDFKELMEQQQPQS
ncbi:hypothetical protein DY218_05325 [Streptomyces triticagri]|uniref:Lipoprotein n=1 Tax=Streptomyces triticagri TaxID=2293568 RepID=A0A372M9T9_9ACTN|nr:hypothetical protein [Streptomyces triticagri]RFU87686.1 hypothetical protein DY218_05325 [Streptomyces triticagri]